MIDALAIARRPRFFQTERQRYATYLEICDDELDLISRERMDAIDTHFQFIFEDRDDPERWGVLPKDSWATSMVVAAVENVKNHPEMFRHS